MLLGNLQDVAFMNTLNLFALICADPGVPQRPQQNSYVRLCLQCYKNIRGITRIRTLGEGVVSICSTDVSRCDLALSAFFIFNIFYVFNVIYISIIVSPGV